jgi:hypothetical protein
MTSVFVNVDKIRDEEKEQVMSISALTFTDNGLNLNSEYVVNYDTINEIPEILSAYFAEYGSKEIGEEYTAGNFYPLKRNKFPATSEYRVINSNFRFGGDSRRPTKEQETLTFNVRIYYVTGRGEIIKTLENYENELIKSHNEYWKNRSSSFGKNK